MRVFAASGSGYKEPSMAPFIRKVARAPRPVGDVASAEGWRSMSCACFLGKGRSRLPAHWVAGGPVGDEDSNGSSWRASGTQELAS